eukprot:s1854_g3.t1
MRRNRSTAQHAPPASAPPSEETTTAASKDSTTTSTAPAPKRDDLEDPTGNWTFQVLGQKWGLLQGRVKLDCDASVPLDAEQRLFLKAALLQMLRTCVDLFQANTSIDYDHWLEDPVLLQVFQEIFQRHFSVLGLMCSLRPWKRKVPDPYLSSLCAPLWLLIDGDMRHWQVHAVEDMRMMSHNQLHLPVDDALDGDVSADLLRPPADPDGDPDGPRGSSSRARRSATFARRAAPLAPSERENDGGNAPGAEAEGPEIEAEADQGEDFDAVRQEPEDDKVLKPKPLFDFKKETMADLLAQQLREDWASERIGENVHDTIPQDLEGEEYIEKKLHELETGEFRAEPLNEVLSRDEIDPEDHKDFVRAKFEEDVQEDLMEKMTLGEFKARFGENPAIASLAVIVEDEEKDKKRIIHDATHGV